MKNQVITLLLAMATVWGTAQEKQYQVACIAYYNFENLFDTLDSPNVDDAEFTPLGANKYTGKVYKEKLSNLSDVVSQLGTDMTPDGAAILGIGEIENISVLQDFVKQPKIAARNYQIVHYDSPYKRGIDVGFIYNPKYFKVLESRNINPELFDKNGDTVYTRDILFIKGEFDGEEMFVFVNHWPSRRGGEAATKHLREGAARKCKTIIDSIFNVNPEARIVLMGDLNDNPDDASCKNILMAKATLAEVQSGGMFNTTWESYKQGIGTLAHRDVWGLFDQIIISHAMTVKEQDSFFFHKYRVFNEPFLFQKSGHYKGYPWRTYSGSTYIGGYSDHLPSVVYMLKEKK